MLNPTSTISVEPRVFFKDFFLSLFGNHNLNCAVMLFPLQILYLLFWDKTFKLFMGIIPIHSHSYSHLEAREENKFGKQKQYTTFTGFKIVSNVSHFSFFFLTLWLFFFFVLFLRKAYTTYKVVSGKQMVSQKLED